MLLWIVFAAVGILAAIILVYKYSKTSRYDTLGFSILRKTLKPSIFSTEDLILVYLSDIMLLWIVFAAVGILAAIILVYKYSKTSRYDTLGFSINCKTCGKKTNGLKCPYCKEEKHDWR